MAKVSFPYQYFPDPTRGKPLFNGSIYIGIADTDPEVESNRIQAYAVTESGDVAVPQPLKTGSGGVVMYSGSAVGIRVDVDSYSVKILDANGSQVYYAANFSPSSTLAETQAAIDTDVTNRLIEKYASVSALKLAELPSGQRVSTRSYYAQDIAQGGAEYDILTLQEVRDAKGDPAWVPDEINDVTLANGNVALRVSALPVKDISSISLVSPQYDYSSDTFTIFDGVATTEHYHGCKVCEGLGGRLHMIFRNGTEHGASGQWSLVYVYSDDGGRTWSSKNVLKSGSTSKIYAPGAILMPPSGKLVIAYNNLTVSGGSVQAPVVYSTLVSIDNGATWSDGDDIDSISYSYARLFGRMKVIPAQNSLGYRLGVTAYHQDSGTPTYRSTVYYSDDDGVSWSEGTPFVSGAGGDNEAEFVFINQFVGFAATRAGGGANWYKTTDGGSTWSLVGTMDQFSAAFDSVAPTLDKFCKDGVWYVVLSMFQRSDDELTWVVGSVADLLADQNAWCDSINKNTGYGNASGYQCPAAKMDGTLDVEGGFSYVVVEEFVASTNSKLNITYIDLIKEVADHPREYTVASGAITLSTSRLEPVIRLDTEAGAATDDLDTINGGYLGQIVVVENVQATSSRDVTLKSGTGNLIINGDYELEDTNSRIVIQNAGATWFELARAHDQVAKIYEISSGVVTLPSSKLPMMYYIGTEASAATDDLDTINGGIDGQIITLTSPSGSRDVTYKDGTGNLTLASDFAANTGADSITLMKRGGNWIEISRSNND